MGAKGSHLCPRRKRRVRGATLRISATLHLGKRVRKNRKKRKRCTTRSSATTRLTKWIHNNMEHRCFRGSRSGSNAEETAGRRAGRLWSTSGTAVRHCLGMKEKLRGYQCDDFREWRECFIDVTKMYTPGSSRLWCVSCPACEETKGQSTITPN